MGYRVVPACGIYGWPCLSQRACACVFVGHRSSDETGIVRVRDPA